MGFSLFLFVRNRCLFKFKQIRIHFCLDLILTQILALVSGSMFDLDQIHQKRSVPLVTILPAVKVVLRQKVFPDLTYHTLLLEVGGFQTSQDHH